MSQPKPEKQKMATITEVYNRIVWDTRLNRNMFIAGFHERIVDGIREKPLAQWDDNSDIPWHRVRYIRCGDTIVWDRDERIDLISIDRLPATAWKSNSTGSSQEDLAALVANNQAKFTPRSVYRFDRNEWKVFTGAIKSIEIETLTVVSYNILSNLHETDKIYTEKRLPVILHELDKTNADIIALQEVTPASIEFILATDWVKNYFISESISGNNVKPYGNLLMSRLPFNLVEYQFSEHKRVLIGNWHLNDRSIQLANVHLTSDYGENAIQKRIQQLATVIGYLQQQPGDCLIVGDFNTRGDEQDEIINYGNFSDLWQQLYPNLDGYTFDPSRNPLAMLMSLEGKPSRFDRILLRQEPASHYQACAVNLFGCEPVSETNGQIFPSDHFGIRGFLKINHSHPQSIERGALVNTSVENPADLTTIRPVYESILAIIPPEYLFPPIQAIRKQYDSGFVNIVPHITLLYGFLPDKYFDKVVDLIAPILAKMSPFTVTLTDFQIFTHHKTATVWLRPVVHPVGALDELQQTLNQLFPQCYEQSTKTAAGFTPHLSVGQIDHFDLSTIKLPQWHPVKFTVDAVSLLSRTHDTPCSTRHIVGLGKLLPRGDRVGTLMGIISHQEPDLNPIERSQRDAVLAIVKQACSDCLGFEASLHLLGSARLDVATANSDLDVVCLIPNYVSGKRFLGRVEACLEGLSDRSQVVVDARFPVLRLQIEGISVDLLYTQVEVTDGWEKRQLQDLQAQIENQKVIIGCWDADTIVDLVKQQISLDTFRSLLKAVRAWAKSRRIYGNSWGFLGGFSWCLLCAYTCVNYREKDRSLEALFAHFFKVLSQHDWSQPIAITDTSKAYPAKIPRDWLPIVSPLEPCKNTARNVTRSTANILQTEFDRGVELTTNILAKPSNWQLLYTPINLSKEFDTSLTITMTSHDREELEKCLGILSSCTIGLVIQLEQLNLFVRPNPQIETNIDTSKIELFINLTAGIELQTIEQLARDFISQLNGIDKSIEFNLSLKNGKLV